MSYCVNCGKEVNENAKFCQYCGKPIVKTNNRTVREFEFAGKIIKCPNCGKVLTSFTGICPACGHELRDNRSSNAIKEFTKQLQSIEECNEDELQGLSNRKAKRIQNERIRKKGEQKISLIQNFSIPNNKEDILEFMILARSNIDYTVFDEFDHGSSDELKREISKAWVSKVDQAYEKATIFCGKEELGKIKTIYDNVKGEIKKEKRSGTKKYSLVMLCLFGFLALLIAFPIIDHIREPKKENERLLAIEQEALSALENQEYKKAILNAEALVYSSKITSGDAEEYSRQWDVKRELLIERIIEEANNNGIFIERTQITEYEDITTADENNNEDSIVSTVPEERTSVDDYDIEDDRGTS